MKTKLFISITILTIGFLIAISLLFPDQFIPTLLIVTFTYGFFNVMYYGKPKYVKRKVTLIGNGWGVPENSQTPIKL